MAQIYKITTGKACFLKLFTIDNILSFHFVFKLVNFRLFFLTYSKILLFQKLGHMPLNEDKLILQAATVYERCLLFKRANMNSVIYTAT